jgi:flagellar biosynthesis/type III secretory pathway M-ring protein FliF/YscJ
MNTILITVLIIFGFVLLLAATYKPVVKNEPKTGPLQKQPKPKKIIMGPENPAWMKMYAEEMAKRNTALTANVLKKWIAEDIRVELRPDISR